MPTGIKRASRGGKKTPPKGPKRKKSTKDKAPKKQPPGGKTGTKRTRTSKSKLVDKAIASFEKKLDSEDVKATVGDFIRLLQLQQELEGEDAEEIRVTWVDPESIESA
jgi:hypothetical protein